jgi:hypothetical protein
VSFTQRNDGRIAVHISQVVRSPDGSVIAKGDFLHLHRLEGGRIARLDIEAHLERRAASGTKPERSSAASSTEAHVRRLRSPRVST